MAPSVRMGQGPASPDADCSQRSMAAATFAPPSPVAWAYTFRVVAELEWPSIADTSGDRHAGRQRRRGRRVPGSVRTALADPGPLAHTIPPPLAVSRVDRRSDDRGENQVPVGPIRTQCRLLLKLVRPMSSQRFDHERRDGNRPYRGAGLRWTDRELSVQPLKRAFHPDRPPGEVDI